MFQYMSIVHEMVCHCTNTPLSLPAGGYVDCFQFLALVNNATVQSHSQHGCMPSLLLWRYLGVELMGFMVIICLYFSETAKLYFPNWFLHQFQHSLSFSTSLLEEKDVSYPSFIHETHSFILHVLNIYLVQGIDDVTLNDKSVFSKVFTVCQRNR